MVVSLVVYLLVCEARVYTSGRLAAFESQLFNLSGTTQLQGKYIKAASVSDGIGVAVTSYNEIYVWGMDAYGQRLVTPNTFLPVPTLVLERSEPLDGIVASLNDVYVWSGTEVFSWGRTTNGEVTSSISYGQPMDNVIKISAVNAHALIMLNSGSLYSIGNNEEGQLGHSSMTNEISIEPARLIAAGYYHSVAVAKYLDLIYAWGKNFDDHPTQRWPTISANDVIAICAGNDFTALLMNNDVLYGIYHPGDSEITMLLPTAHSATNIECGERSVSVVAGSNSVWTYSLNTNNVWELYESKTFEGLNISSIAYQNTWLLRTVDGMLYGRGKADECELGDNSVTLIPNEFEVLGSMLVDYSFVGDNSLWVKGFTFLLGKGDFRGVDFAEVGMVHADLPLSQNFRQIVEKDRKVYILSYSGEFYTSVFYDLPMAYNQCIHPLICKVNLTLSIDYFTVTPYNTLLFVTGDGLVIEYINGDFRTYPNQEEPFLATKVVATSDQRIYVLYSNGRVYSCYAMSCTFMPVFDIVDITSSSLHVVALTQFGKVYTWGGRADRGELGFNDTSLLPRLVTGLQQYFVVQIAAKLHGTAVLTDTSKLIVFGDNTKGQFGNGQVEVLDLQNPIPMVVLNTSLINLDHKNSKIMCSENICAIDTENECYGAYGSICNGHGQCALGSCICDAYYSGSKCESYVPYSPPQPIEPSPRPSEAVHNSPSAIIKFCFGIASNDDVVCSSHGSCVAEDICDCEAGYTGFECEHFVYPSSSYIEQSEDRLFSSEILQSSYSDVDAQSSLRNSPSSDTSAQTGPSANYERSHSSSTEDSLYQASMSQPEMSQAGYSFSSEQTESNGRHYSSDAHTGQQASSEMDRTYICFDFRSDDSAVCSGHGICSFDDNCDCEQSYGGQRCELSVIQSGIVSIYPRTGVALTTTFELNMTGWENVQTFSVGYLTGSTQNLIATIETNSLNFVLPQGNLTIFVRASNSLDSVTQLIGDIEVLKIDDDKVADTVTKVVSEITANTTVSTISAISTTIVENRAHINASAASAAVEQIVNILHTTTKSYQNSTESSTTVVILLSKITQDTTIVTQNSSQTVALILSDLITNSNVLSVNNSLETIRQTVQNIENISLATTSDSAPKKALSKVVSAIVTVSRNNLAVGSSQRVRFDKIELEIVKLEPSSNSSIVRTSLQDPRSQRPLSVDFTTIAGSSNTVITLQSVVYPVSMYDNTLFATSVVTIDIFVESKQRTIAQEQMSYVIDLPVADKLTDNTTYTCRTFDTNDQSWKNDTDACQTVYDSDNDIVRCECTIAATVGATLDYVQSKTEEIKEQVPSNKKKLAPGVIAVIVILVVTVIVVILLVTIVAVVLAYRLKPKNNQEISSDLQVHKNKYTLFYQLSDLKQHVMRR